MIKKIIEKDTKIICQLLMNRNILTLDELKELTEYQELYLSMILGWLAKENRIHLDMDNELSVRLIK